MNRIKLLLAAVIFAAALAAVMAGGAGGTGVWPAASERKLTCGDIAGKDSKTVNLMKNEIYARRGRPFKTDLVKEYFESQPWYNADEKYTDAKLSKLELENISFLAQCDKTLDSGGKCCASTGGKELPLNIAGVVNLKQFGSFPLDAKAKIEKGGMVAMPGPEGGYDQFFFIYEINDYNKLPSFITSDSILHTYHVFFDFSLRDVEENKMLPILEKLTNEMIVISERDVGNAKPPLVKNAAIRNTAYFAVADFLLQGKMPQVNGESASLANKEISLIKAGGGSSPSPVTGAKIDYSMFKPRGHYTRSENLRKYFMAMMWYGISPFVIDEQDFLPAIMSILITKNLYSEKDLISNWESIYEPTAFFVGVADDITPSMIWKEIGSRSPTAEQLSDEAWISGIAKKIINCNPARVIQVTRDGPQSAQFRFMGQRYTPDGEVLQNLSDPDKRPFPRGLDVVAALGVEEAGNILRDVYKEGSSWPQYWERLDTQKQRLAKLTPDEWKQNLYYRWIHALKTTNEIPQGKTPAFMLTRPWKLKSLITSLGSWAELRHDTILYAKPSAAECGGDEYEEPFVKGYVEPNPKLYAELKELVAATRDGLSKRGLLTDSFIDTSKSLEELVDFLERMSVKELKGESLTRQEHDQIRIFGATLENLTVRLMTGSYEGWDMVTGPDRSVAVIADIHSAGGAALEEAVGKVWEIYVVAPIDGRKYLTRGAVFSYYEFTHPASDRLTDEQWQKMLKEGEAPPPPIWTQPFTCGESKGKIPQTKAYSSGC